ncbi:hypothetical protein I317_07940 [Kwoniella heveanensis CBS 569]|uniref:Protein YAE1 n=1 Tax=Kwoniella heveanensis BCC8398 TaxID=1296120 RepID=A0A1B9H241_9TREE|nr:hypothetical protein I316_00468 [Kwoniella heveanensis BCC8398]OCF38300.1 hypothetical protein I317_07940 [Kwoniella heveanensis CBS 569]
MAYPPVTDHQEEDDDWLDPPAQGGANDPLVDREYTRISSKFSDAGYREGITDGKLATLQQGFDEGFARSVPLSRRVGFLRGRAAALLAIVTSSSSTSSPAASPLPSQSVTPTSHASTDLINTLRDLIRRLGQLRRGEILPEDKERIEHEKENHPDGEGYELDQTDKRDMESLERSLGLMGDAETRQKVDGEVVIGRLEAELTELKKALFRR